MEAKGIATMTALVVGIMFMMQLVTPGMFSLTMVSDEKCVSFWVDCRTI